MAAVLHVPADSVTASTTQDQCERWDSVEHLNLMLAIEERFGKRLDIETMARLTSVAAILGFLEDR
jgi:acyl carrier protein